MPKTAAVPTAFYRNVPCYYIVKTHGSSPNSRFIIGSYRMLQPSLNMVVSRRHWMIARGVIALLACAAIASSSERANSVPVVKPSLGIYGLVTSARMMCDSARCFNPRTGAYTASSCDYHGCYRIGRVLGYLSDKQLRKLRRRHYRARQYSKHPNERYRYGGSWDCNYSRCIDLHTGELWESTCRGARCRPLQPAY